MKRLLLSGCLVFSSCSAGAATVSSIDPAHFLSSPMCAQYKCRPAGQSGNTHRYTIRDEADREVQIRIIREGKINHLLIYAAKGSLKFAPSTTVMQFMKLAAFYYTNVKLNLKNDLLGSTSALDVNKKDFFDLATGKIGSLGVTLYEASLPDVSLDPGKGQLVYGIIESKLYPPQRPLR